MRLTLSLSMMISVVTGCSPAGEQDPTAAGTAPMAAETSTTVEASRETRRAVPSPAATSTERTAFASTMPEAVRGQWRENDLGRDPTREDCNQTSQSNSNFGKVLTVDAGGYSVFEDGGRIIDVHNRTDDMIDATFDTTYADTPTRARKDFALQSNGSLAVNNDDEDGRAKSIEYLRCR